MLYHLAERRKCYSPPGAWWPCDCRGNSRLLALWTAGPKLPQHAKVSFWAQCGDIFSHWANDGRRHAQNDEVINPVLPVSLGSTHVVLVPHIIDGPSCPCHALTHDSTGAGLVTHPTNSISTVHVVSEFSKKRSRLRNQTGKTSGF